MSDPVPSVDVAANIRAELGRRRMTYQDLAEKVAGRSDLTYPLLRDRLVGRTEFRVSELPAIAEALGVSLATLLGEHGARAS